MQEEKTVAIGISLNVQVDGNKQLALQTAIERDTDSKEIDAILDKLFVAVDRKRAQYEYEEIEKDIELHEKQLRNMAEDLDRVDEKAKEEYANSNRRGEYKPSPQQKTARDNILLTKKRYEDEIAIRKEKLLKLKAKIDAGR
jgi:hypothetical protein